MVKKDFGGLLMLESGSSGVLCCPVYLLSMVGRAYMALLYGTCPTNVLLRIGFCCLSLFLFSLYMVVSQAPKNTVTNFGNTNHEGADADHFALGAMVGIIGVSLWISSNEDSQSWFCQT